MRTRERERADLLYEMEVCDFFCVFYVTPPPPTTKFAGSGNVDRDGI